MKGLIHLIILVVLTAIPVSAKCRTVAYSPSISGQPLIFHFNTTFNKMRPALFSATTWAELDNTLLVQSTYAQHLENLSPSNCCKEWNTWVNGIGRWEQQKTKDYYQLGYHDTTGGLTIGADICLNDFVLGLAASYTHSNLNWNESNGNSQINSYYGGLYGNWKHGCLYVNTSLLAGCSRYETSRHLLFGSIDSHARAHHNGWQVLTGIETGTILQQLFYTIDLVPFISFDYIYLSQQGFEEDGAGRFNLNVKNRHDQLLQSEIGVKFKRPIVYEFCSNNWTISPNLSLSYINQTSLAKKSYYFNFVGRERQFSLKGWDFERNLGVINLGFNFLNEEETINISLDYDGQFGKNYWSQAGNIMCNICF